MTAERTLICCSHADCGQHFYFVSARGERAIYCLDHATEIFGHHINGGI